MKSESASKVKNPCSPLIVYLFTLCLPSFILHLVTLILASPVTYIWGSLEQQASVFSIIVNLINMALIVASISRASPAQRHRGSAAAAAAAAARTSYVAQDLPTYGRFDRLWRVWPDRTSYLSNRRIAIFLPPFLNFLTVCSFSLSVCVCTLQPLLEAMPFVMKPPGLKAIYLVRSILGTSLSFSSAVSGCVPPGRSSLGRPPHRLLSAAPVLALALVHCVVAFALAQSGVVDVYAFITNGNDVITLLFFAIIVVFAYIIELGAEFIVELVAGRAWRYAPWAGGGEVEAPFVESSVPEKGEVLAADVGEVLF